MAGLIGGVIAVPVMVGLTLVLLWWETVWVSEIYKLVAPTQGWPAISLTSWLAINCIVTILARGPAPKERDTSFEHTVFTLAAPVLCWLVVLTWLWMGS